MKTHIRNVIDFEEKMKETRQKANIIWYFPNFKKQGIKIYYYWEFATLFEYESEIYLCNSDDSWVNTPNIWLIGWVNISQLLDEYFPSLRISASQMINIDISSDGKYIEFFFNQEHFACPLSSGSDIRHYFWSKHFQEQVIQQYTEIWDFYRKIFPEVTHTISAQVLSILWRNSPDQK